MQPDLRESPDSQRESRRGAAGASPIAEGFGARARVWARNLSVSAGAGLFLALIGALSTDEAPLVTRVLFWVPLMVGGAVIGHFVSMAVSRIPRAGSHPWLFVALLAIVASIPITLLVWAYSGWVLGANVPFGSIHTLFGPVLIISAAMTSLIMVVSAPGAVTHAPPAGAPASPVRFLERLPAKIKGGVLYAVSSEDHYLRLHTSKGADLILMRLSDAIVELEGLEGAQTHRSWWVARDAVEGVRREGDKVTLVLKGGVEAPVSRPNVRPLREAGWF